MIEAEAKQALVAWFNAEGRDLPWRRVRDPYRILVSEVMLQQTQVDRVIPKYHEFLALFPDAKTLAQASAGDVLRAWSGLGYNRRALNLQRACQAVVERFDGEFPHDVEELLSLPGVGPYTAGAIACFAFEHDVGFVDTNIRRVLHRISAGPELPEPKLTERELRELASRSVPEGQGWVWNQALIELGAIICRARTVACEICPVGDWCDSRYVIRQAIAATPRTRTPGPRFEDTSRYVRGRIVEFLREHPEGLQSNELADRIRPAEPNTHWIHPYLDALEIEGLIERVAGGVREELAGYDDQQPAGEDSRYRLPQ